MVAAGLPVLTGEATDVQFHAHLDILVDVEPVSVPADLGIAAEDAISSMHTHDATGVIHIDAPAAATFTLGQLFTEWQVPQVPLTATCVNTVCDGSGGSWQFHVNGRPYPGDPAHIDLGAHQQIAATYGNPPAGGPPAGYSFPPGL
jgi:hypothetical protein